ncbi:MAG: hypothetical protein ABJN65_02365 [Parasphingorhabdus sp.]
MNERDHLEDYLKICKRMYLRMEREGTWPWKEEDSTETEDMIDSEHNP